MSLESKITSVYCSFPIHEFVRLEQLPYFLGGKLSIRTECHKGKCINLCKMTHWQLKRHAESYLWRKRLIVLQLFTILQSLCWGPLKMCQHNEGRQWKLCPNKLPLASATARSLLLGALGRCMSHKATRHPAVCARYSGTMDKKKKKQLKSVSPCRPVCDTNDLGGFKIHHNNFNMLSQIYNLLPLSFSISPVSWVHTELKSHIAVLFRYQSRSLHAH